MQVRVSDPTFFFLGSFLIILLESRIHKERTPSEKIETVLFSKGYHIIGAAILPQRTSRITKLSGLIYQE
jgi:hypothetical protein